MVYLMNFIVYMLAMVGVMMVALFVFKQTTGCKVKNVSTNKSLKVTETLSLNARKTLYVVEADGERFLIAGDIDRTTLISKLGAKTNLESNSKNIVQKNAEMNLGIYTTQKSPYESAIRNLAEKIKR